MLALPFTGYFIFLVTLFYRRPGHPVGSFFVGAIAQALVRVFIFLPGVIESFHIDLLGVFGQIIPYSRRQITQAVIWHAKLLLAPGEEKQKPNEPLSSCRCAEKSHRPLFLPALGYIHSSPGADPPVPRCGP